MTNIFNTIVMIIVVNTVVVVVRILTYIENNNCTIGSPPTSPKRYP